MPRYRVYVAVSGTEIYEFEAENEEAAWNGWYDEVPVGAFDGDNYEAVDLEELED